MWFILNETIVNTPKIKRQQVIVKKEAIVISPFLKIFFFAWENEYLNLLNLIFVFTPDFITYNFAVENFYNALFHTVNNFL